MGPGSLADPHHRETSLAGFANRAKPKFVLPLLGLRCSLHQIFSSISSTSGTYLWNSISLLAHFWLSTQSLQLDPAGRSAQRHKPREIKITLSARLRTPRGFAPVKTIKLHALTHINIMFMDLNYWNYNDMKVSKVWLHMHLMQHAYMCDYWGWFYLIVLPSSQWDSLELITR